VSICVWLRRGRGEARYVWGASLALALTLALSLSPGAAADPLGPDPTTGVDARSSGLRPDAFGTPEVSTSPARTEPVAATSPVTPAPSATTAPTSTLPSETNRPTQAQSAAAAPTISSAPPPVDVSAPFTPSAAAVPPPRPSGNPPSHQPSAIRVEGGARLSSVLIPTHVGGVAPAVAPSSFTSTDLAAADTRRPAIVEPLLHSSSLVVPASLVLLLLVAASGSFLLLAHRIARGGSPRTP
jgi:hypothetical protein